MGGPIYLDLNPSLDLVYQPILQLHASRSSLDESDFPSNSYTDFLVEQPAILEGLARGKEQKY